MSQIRVDDLTFYYEGSADSIFEHASFSIDTRWKLGFIGRNGKGKTTFLKLLLGEYEYRGKICADVAFDYFPYQLSGAWEESCAAALLTVWKADCEKWRVVRELELMGTGGEVLQRPYGTLSHGERTKVMLAVLFSGEHDFLLIDEPTNHLDQASRESVKAYLAKKNGFLLVSHDRDLLDACTDHVLVLNRQSIEVQAGNFSSWEENRRRQDTFARMENEKHQKEISHLKRASGRTRQWANANERTKIGYDPVREHDRPTRAYIGAKTKKMEKRRKQMEVRLERELEEKEGLLKDVETAVSLKMFPLEHHKEVLFSVKGYGLGYEGKGQVFDNLNFSLRRGSRIFLNGKNGCGKSSLIRALLGRIHERDGNGVTEDARISHVSADGKNALWESGTLEAASGITVSYVNQDTAFLEGSISEFCRERKLDESLFCSLLRQLGLERRQLSGCLEEFSQGQKKKVLIAASVMTPAHLYIWDEPLNYMDVFSRIQQEELILSAAPTMLIVEHDVRFREKIATQVIEM